MNSDQIIDFISQSKQSSQVELVAKKVLSNERINTDDCLVLFEQASVGLLGTLANYVREKKNGQYTYFNHNIHIEPTNICVYGCRFCSYARKAGESGSWENSMDEMIDKVRSYVGSNITEVHIVGGVHPSRHVYFYAELLRRIKAILPNIHIKAFTAIELQFMSQKAGMSLADGLKYLKESGLDSIPGGGAEIFDAEIRGQICPEKLSGEHWLQAQETAHLLGIPSNATMLYGHIETYKHRIDHLNRLRILQDKTSGFNAFIPLKYRNADNLLSDLGEITAIEDLKNYAISRIFLDNIPHLKAYWPMIGKEITQLSLAYGVDDVDGTIDNTTKIYTMAGVETEEHNTTLTTTELLEMIQKANRIPVERDTLYNIIKIYG